MGVFRDIKLYAQARKWVREYYRDQKNGLRVYKNDAGNNGSTEAFPRINRTHTKPGTPIEHENTTCDSPKNESMK